jgi:polysaccharide export outer membrane protein
MPAKLATVLALVAVAVLVAACSASPVRRDAPRAAAAGTVPGTTQPLAHQTPAAPRGEDYRLGPGDAIKISVYNNADLTTETELSRAGTIGFPLLGEVQLGGLTRSEAERVIAERLDVGGFVPKAHVTLLVAQYRSRQVSVLGEVNKPGVYPLSQTATLTDLLAAAGGITAKGSSVVSLVRRDANGLPHRYQVDVNRMLGVADLSRNVEVAADDIIFVPPVPLVYVYGEVRQPGAYPLQPDMTVQQVLSVSGGLTLRGTERGIRVDRKQPDGRLERRIARLEDRVQPNDVVRVPESWF